MAEINEFVHLHVHTEYSLLDGSNKIKDYVKRIKGLGMTSGAITDHGNMYGVIEFYKTMKEAGLNPVVGCEVYVSPNSMHDKTNSGDDRYNHLILLAETTQGYENLCKIVSLGFLEGFYYRPRIDIDVLKKYHKGLICLSACLAGIIPRKLLRGDYEDAKATAIKYREIFGEGNYFLEIQDHGIPDEKIVIPQLMKISQETGIELVATNDCHYTMSSDMEAHDVLLCVQTEKKVTDNDRMRYQGDYSVKSEQEMRELFPYALQAVSNTKKIADRCHVEIKFGEYKIPKYQIPEDYQTPLEYLKWLSDEGFKQKYPEDNKDGQIYRDMQFELSVIEKMGFVEYILIVWDYINWAKTHDCMVGPGRGSAAGSKVCYCIGITDVDPVKYNLLFERFLNPERVSMPDIDVDFEYSERQRVIDDYIIPHYGKDNVTQITTFQTLAARAVIKAVGKAMDFPYTEMDKLSKMVPEELHITVQKAIETNNQLFEIYNSDDRHKKLLDIAMKLEGLPKSTSIHAAGVIIYPDSAINHLPIGRSKEGAPTCQYNMVQIEELGLLKMDFLGLRTLTVIKDAVKNIKTNHGIEVDIDNIDVNDKKVLDFISTGKTEGVFQLESGGMQSFMKELKPQSFEDIIAGISLYRPGPMDFIPDYIKGKNQPENITYACPELEHILEPTYGCIVYQEQVMQIVRDLAGYTMGQADSIRRAMSKKKQSVIDAGRADFVYGNAEKNINGCIKNGIAEETANKIYDSMVDFAKYAFNKSHAAAYAIIAIQTAWLKAYFPVEYMAALMTSVIDQPIKLKGYMLAAKKSGIDILPPDINESMYSFIAKGNSIRFALSAIKNVGKAVVQKIENRRIEKGPFTSFTEFIEEAGDFNANKKAIESFAKAGVFACLGVNRRQCLSCYEDLLKGYSKKSRNMVEGQLSLFDNPEIKEVIGALIPNVPEMSKKDILDVEKEVTGIYISGHPLDNYEKVLSKKCNVTSAMFIVEENGERSIENEQEVTYGGIITDIRRIYTKKNQLMAFIKVEDLIDTVEVVVFPKTYEKAKDYIVEDNKIIIKGKVSAEENSNKLLADEISPINTSSNVWLQFSTIEEYHKHQVELDIICNDYEGTSNLFIYLSQTKEKKLLMKKVSPCEQFVVKICSIVGENNLKIS